MLPGLKKNHNQVELKLESWEGFIGEQTIGRTLKF